MRGTYADASSPEAHAALPDCAGGESFALMVLGHSMAPEFNEGEIIVIEPDGLAREGSYVLAWNQEEWTFRQLLRSGAEWVLHPLNPEVRRRAAGGFLGRARGDHPEGVAWAQAGFQTLYLKPEPD
ncbi:MAG: S24 family peptidase [Chromatiales bacterium]|nr:S24 family peptidase [Chromatiales bacterium]